MKNWLSIILEFFNSINTNQTLVKFHENHEKYRKNGLW
jgi:hypothetical protein